jgi:prevent-host-death family protein
MKRASLVHAKNHFSEVVDDAEHRGVSTVILRHGKPCAVVVPLALAPNKKAMSRLTDEQWEALLAEAARQDNPGFSAVRDIREGRDKR